MDIEENKREKSIDKGEQELINGERNHGIMGWGYRHQQTAILFCCLTVAYSMRSCMGVALVAMTEDKNIVLNYTADNDTNKVDQVSNAGLFTTPYPKFQWSKQIQDVILASFFWGYMLLQIPSGLLAHRFGTRYLLTGSMMVNCVASICLPCAAYYSGWVLTAILRIIQGLSQSCIFPSMHTAFGKWIPLEERGRLAAFAYGGQGLGTFLGMPITGFIAGSPIGWPGIFGFYGIISGLAGALIWFFGVDSPAEHKKISVKERRYIEEALRQSEPQKKLPLPWKRIFLSPGMISIVVAHTSHSWCYVILFSEVPAFMDKIMKVNIETIGLLSALPFLVMWLANFVYSYMTDMLIVRKILSVTNTRKLANTIGSVPVAIGLVVLSYVKQNIYIAEIALIVICGCKTATNVGFLINHIDIAPNFAGTMLGISNFISNGLGSLAPIATAAILTDDHSEVLWRKVFFVAAGLCFFANLFYLIFGTAELADWNEPKREREDEENPMLRKTTDTTT